MEVAGDPVGREDRARLRSAATCRPVAPGAVNHYYDRDIDAQMARTASRPIPAGRVSPRAALIFGCALAAALVRADVADAEPARGVAGVRRIRRLRRRLHDLAQAAHPAEHRDRRRRGRDSAAGRLGGHARLALVDGRLPVRDRLLLDAAALLGAEPADEGRVRQGRRADAARSSAASARPAGRSCCTRCCSTRSLSCRSARGHSASSTWSASIVLGARHSSAGGAALPPRRTARRRSGSTCTRWRTWRCCSARWSPTSSSELAIGPARSRPAATPATR